MSDVATIPPPPRNRACPRRPDPIIEIYSPPEGWGWRFLDETVVDLPDQTPQLGPTPRYV